MTSSERLVRFINAMLARNEISPDQMVGVLLVLGQVKFAEEKA